MTFLLRRTKIIRNTREYRDEFLQYTQLMRTDVMTKGNMVHTMHASITMINNLHTHYVANFTKNLVKFRTYEILFPFYKEKTSGDCHSRSRSKLGKARKRWRYIPSKIDKFTSLSITTKSSATAPWQWSKARWTEKICRRRVGCLVKDEPAQS